MLDEIGNTSHIETSAMTDVRRFAGLDLILLLAIVAGAAVLRLGYTRTYANEAKNDGLFAVQDDREAELNALALSLREGRGYVARAPLATQEEPTAHVAIGYPWLLSRVDGYWVNMESEQLVRWIQCALGALTAGLYFLFARRAFQSLLVGTLAGVLCAVYPLWIFNVAEKNDGTLVTFLLALSLFLGVRGGQSGGPLTSLLFGISLAGLSCVRAAMIPFAVVAVLWFLWRCRVLQRGWLYSVLAFLGFVNGLIPIVAWNYQQFRSIVPVTDSAYLHLWIGNNPRATGGPMSNDEIERVLAYTSRGEKTRLEELQQQRQPERYSQLMWDIRDEIQNHPAETFQRRLRAGLGFFLTTSWLEGQPLVRETAASREGLPEWLDRSLPTILPASLFFLLLLGVLGWRWSYGWRLSAMPSSLAVMWIPLPYILGHAEMFHGPRLPLDGVLISYAALAIVCLIPGIGRSLLRGEQTEPAY